ncbi:MAG: glycosyltransferase family 39 protein [Lachnospiraceae bacterium]|nr:glycosyltransferase family 39 protein [Lachnospiraceae bacterium]
MKSEKKEILGRKENIGIIMLILILSGLFVFLFSVSTSPIVKDFYYWDSAIFQTVGKAWSQGMLPYTECFDHKGPLLFLMEALGYSFGIGKTGVAIVQTVYLFAAFWFIYKIARLFMDCKFALVTTVLSFITLTLSYDGGNFSEEFSLLFINSSIYLGIKYFKQIQSNKNEKSGFQHSPWYAFWYGMSFMAMTMLRMTNALSVCCIILVVMCVLISKKEIKNLLLNMLYCILGMVVCCLPFVIYYIVKGKLYDLLFGTIVYNILYLAGSSMDISMTILKAALISFVFIAVSFVHIVVKGKHDMLGVFSLLYGVLSTGMFFFMNGYVHYQIIVIVFVPMTVGLMVDIWNEKRFKQFGRVTVVVAVVLLGIECLFGVKEITKTKENIASFEGYVEQYNSIVEQFNSIIPENEKNQVLTFGSRDLNSWYLVNDVNPPYKYFILQDWQTSHCALMKEEVTAFLESKSVKWIITDADQNGNMIMENNQNYKKIIEENYDKVSNYSSFSMNFNLYCLK